MESEKSQIVLVENIFSKELGEVKYKDQPTIKTYFSDTQVKNICSKMSNSKIRHFSNLFFTESKQVDYYHLRYQLHSIANNALQFFGGIILTFIYNLPNWPLRSRNTDILKSTINDLTYLTGNFPKFEIKSYENGQHYTIRFRRAVYRNVRNIPLFSIRDNTSYKESHVLRDGSLSESLTNIIPEFLLFQTETKTGLMLYAGYSDDVCDICGKPLSDYESVMYGRGPVCRRDYGNP